MHHNNMVCVAMRGRNPEHPTDRTPGIHTEQRLEMNKDGYVETVYRIRKLTPKECFRLMSFRDEDYEAASKVNSNSQLYKQAGNSICECVLKAIFSQMGIKGIPRWNDTH